MKKEYEIRTTQCEKCEYARHHYTVFDGQYTKLTNVLHCANEKVSNKQFELIFNDVKICSLRKENTERRQNTEQSIKRILLRISEKLDNIAQVLKNDDE